MASNCGLSASQTRQMWTWTTGPSNERHISTNLRSAGLFWHTEGEGRRRRSASSPRHGLRKLKDHLAESNGLRGQVLLRGLAVARTASRRQRLRSGRGRAFQAALFPAAPVIGPQDVWGIWAVLLAAAAGGLWSERTEIGQRLSGPLVATLLGLLASNAGLIPSDAPAYGVVTRFLLPLAVPLLLFRADLRRVVRDTGRLLLAFALGAVGTVLGTLVAFHFLPLRSLGNDSWKIAAALMSRHIGGAVNYVAVTEALGATSSVVAAGLAADNLICAVYFTTLFALGAGIPAEPLLPPTIADTTRDVARAEEEGSGDLRLLEATTALALSATICAAGVALARAANFRGGTIPCVTALVVLLATLRPSWLAPLAPVGEVLAGILMQIFFSMVGANGDVSSVVRTAPVLFLFSFLQIAVHLAFILGAGRLLGCGRKELLLASNANVGGPTTGAGMATAKGWRSLLVPTILVGIFGYAIATFGSILLGHGVLRAMAR